MLSSERPCTRLEHLHGEFDVAQASPAEFDFAVFQRVGNKVFDTFAHLLAVMRRSCLAWKLSKRTVGSYPYTLVRGRCRRLPGGTLSRAWNSQFSAHCS